MCICVCICVRLQISHTNNQHLCNKASAPYNSEQVSMDSKPSVHIFNNNTLYYIYIYIYILSSLLLCDFIYLRVQHSPPIWITPCVIFHCDLRVELWIEREYRHKQWVEEDMYLNKDKSQGTGASLRN